MRAHARKPVSQAERARRLGLPRLQENTRIQLIGSEKRLEIIERTKAHIHTRDNEPDLADAATARADAHAARAQSMTDAMKALNAKLTGRKS